MPPARSVMSGLASTFRDLPGAWKALLLLLAPMTLYGVFFAFVFEEGPVGEVEGSVLQALSWWNRANTSSHLLLKTAGGGCWAAGVLCDDSRHRTWVLLNPSIVQCDKTFSVGQDAAAEQAPSFRLSADELFFIARTPAARRSVITELGTHVR